MQLTKWIAMALAATMLLAGLTGCKSTQNEESAQTDGYVEGMTQSTESENSTPAVRGEGQVTYETTQKPSANDEKEEDGDTPVDNGSTNSDKEQQNISSDKSEEKEEEGTQSEENENEESVPEEDKGEEEVEEEETESEPKPETKPETKPNTGSTADTGGDYIKVVSYNIRYTNDPNGRSVEERAPRLKKLLEEYDPDIIGFQEVTPIWLPYLIEDYAGEYTYFHKYRSAKDKEGAPIYWKADKFQLLDSGSFWLSETPDVESKGWNGSHVRMAMWVKLKVKATGKEFLYINTHYDSGSEIARRNSPALVIERMKAMGGFTKYPVIFTADCNASPSSVCYKEMYKAFVDVNAELQNDKTSTFTGYGAANGLIDYCFISPKSIIPLKYEVINSFVDGNYASDHNGVYAALKLK